MNFTLSLIETSVSLPPSTPLTSNTLDRSSKQQDSTIMNTARDFLMRGIRFLATLCGRKSEKKPTYEWEERLAYVEAEHEADDGAANEDEHDMQFERSCGVVRYRD
jgi:hypothetical protein